MPRWWYRYPSLAMAVGSSCLRRMSPIDDPRMAEWLPRSAVGTTGFDERLEPGQLPAEHPVDDGGDVAKTAGAEAADRVNQFDRRAAARLQQVPRHRPGERRLLQWPDRASQPKQLAG